MQTDGRPPVLRTRARARTQTSAVVTASAVLLALSGCAGMAADYADRIAEAAALGDDFALPQVDAPVRSWEQVLVICPYTPTDDVPTPFAAAASRLDTSANEGVHWLMFRSGAEVETLRLPRDHVDLCAGDVGADVAFESSTRWKAREDDGSLQVSVAT